MALRATSRELLAPLRTFPLPSSEQADLGEVYELDHGTQSIGGFGVTTRAQTPPLGANGDGAWVDQRHFFNLIAYAGKAESAAKRLHKGDRIAAQGRLQQREGTPPTAPTTNSSRSSSTASTTHRPTPPTTTDPTPPTPTDRPAPLLQAGGARPGTCCTTSTSSFLSHPHARIEPEAAVLTHRRAPATS